MEMEAKGLRLLILMLNLVASDLKISEVLEAEFAEKTMLKELVEMGAYATQP